MLWCCGQCQDQPEYDMNSVFAKRYVSGKIVRATESLCFPRSFDIRTRSQASWTWFSVSTDLLSIFHRQLQDLTNLASQTLRAYNNQSTNNQHNVFSQERSFHRGRRSRGRNDAAPRPETGLKLQAPTTTPPGRRCGPRCKQMGGRKGLPPLKGKTGQRATTAAGAVNVPAMVDREAT